MFFFFVVTLVVLNIKCVSTIRYSHTITEDAIFYYQQLTTIPSLVMEVEFSIFCIHHGLEFHLPMTEDIKFHRNCTAEHFKQLKNDDLSAPLRPGKYRNYLCLELENGLLNCTRKTVIQDFRVRNLGFYIQSKCIIPKIMSLKGLSFNISVSGQKNKSECVPLHETPTLDCFKYYSSTSFPNLFGQHYGEAADFSLAFLLIVSQFSDGCYKFLKELLCYLYIPKCDATRGVTVPPCRENCWDFEKGCLGIVLKAYPNTKIFLNCNYLPEKDSDITCYYRVVTCEDPPKIPNGKVEGRITINGTHPLHTQLHVKCINETFVMKGNSTITCGYTGTWSQPPQCVFRACPVPPMVEHAHIDKHQNGSEVYPWHTQVTYICDNKTFHMEGNRTITCLKNEHWSPVPDCVEFTNNKSILKALEIILPTVFLILLVILSSCLVVCYKKKLKMKHICNRLYDDNKLF